MAGIVACTKDDDTAAVTPVEKAEVTTLNVDVVLPASVREDWQLTIDMAQKNIALAQQKLKKQAHTPAQLELPTVKVQNSMTKNI